MKTKFLTFPFEIKDADEKKGMIEGYASTFGNIDLGLDVVDKGAFSKTIRESGGKVPILADHNPSKQIGWNLSASEDEKGLLVKGELDVENNQAAKERFSLVRKALEIGAKAGLSIGYYTIKAEPDVENPRIRRLKELKLFEYSLVTFPMNTEAMTTAAKHWAEGLQKDTLNESVLAFIEQLKSRGFSMDDINQALLDSGAAEKASDPDNLIQSMDRLISAMKN